MRNLCCLVSALVLTFVAAPAAAQKVTVDFADYYDFDSVKTFEYKDSEQSLEAANPLMHPRIVEMLIAQLEQGGAEQVDADPDVFVTYYVQATDRSEFTTTGMGYSGYYGGWGRYNSTTHIGVDSMRARESSFTEGTLIVDVWDSETETLIWRGISVQSMKSNPEKVAQQVEKALKKMSKQWQKIRQEDSQ